MFKITHILVGFKTNKMKFKNIKLHQAWTLYIYIYGMEGSKKSLFSTSFDRGRLFPFENESDLQIIHSMSLIIKTSFYCRLLPSCSKIKNYGL